ncbi:tetraspanin-31-like [Chiloscyllium plagiosum]|uniref:tetraspanin-31-like n=1 Tax=Chiloscyllium plagiosum TaxID=36176 RepID=UPI001CB7EF9C|nr:tetraspanin-31-like [Chiloscyllium plagiosum]
MVCGGFTCSKNALIALNVVYILVGLLLIGVAAWGKSYGIVSSINIIGGVIAVGVFLLLIAVVGLIGAVNHHQVMLFFYMVILFLVFLIQFGVSCSCLALNRSQQVPLAVSLPMLCDFSLKRPSLLQFFIGMSVSLHKLGFISHR